MAKKPRTPPPPRPVQAPKTRRPEPNEKRARLLLYGFAAAGVVALAVVLAVIFTGGGGGGSSTDVAAAMKSAGCTFKTVDASVPKGGNTHVASLTAPIHWNTFPPSNGQHNPTPAVWDFYTQPVNPRLVVHNEEHGGVIIWWGEQTPAAQVDRLRQLYNDDPQGMLGTPIDGLGSKVAITAWTGDPSHYTKNGYYGQGHIGTCPQFDDAADKAFIAFRDAYRGKGPEGVPTSANSPGT